MNILLKCLALDFRSSTSRLYEVVSIVACSTCLALIVLVFTSLRSGLYEMIESAGSDTIVIILGNGSGSEVISSFTGDEVDSLKAKIKAEYGQRVFFSPELFTNIRAESSDSAQIVAVRGVEGGAFDLRQNFNILSGRMFQIGKREIIVGEQLASRFEWLQLNQKITLGLLEWTIVGIFEADEMVVESEIWGDVNLLQNAYNRTGVYQSIRLRLDNADTAHRLVMALNDNTDTTSVLAQTQREYYADQIQEMTDFVDVIAIPSIAILMLATGFSGLQSMHTMVEVRLRETAILRAIGFPVFKLAVSTFFFAIALSIVGATLGILIAAVVFSQAKAVILNHLSMSEVVFPFSISVSGLSMVIVSSIAIAVVGGFPPALVTLRVSIVKAIRKS